MSREKAELCYLTTIGLAVLIVSSLLLNGCATTGKSLALGGAIGAGTGAIAGGLADPGQDGQYRTRNVLIGTALGGVAGIAAGGLIHDSVTAQSEAAYKKGQMDAKSTGQPLAGNPPRLSQAKVEAHWVEGKITGNRYIEPHWEYQIVEPARWEGN